MQVSGIFLNFAIGYKMIVDYSGEQRLLARQNCSGLFYAHTNILAVAFS
nr:MAG TPA: hypothetical protein [Caudoviricetes sp.]